METISSNVHAVVRSHRWRWTHSLLIAEAWLLILITGSAGLMAAWFTLKNTLPLPKSSIPLTTEPKRSPAATTPCIVRDADPAPAQGRTCIIEH